MWAAPAHGSLVTKASPSLKPMIVVEIGDDVLGHVVQAQRQARHVDADEQAVAVRRQQRTVEILGLVDHRRAGQAAPRRGPARR